MCEFNRPYPVPFGHHPDDLFRSHQIEVLSRDAWDRHAARLAMQEVEVIEQAVREAAALQSDVHLYRSAASPYVGISLKPGDGPTVKIWEW